MERLERMYWMLNEIVIHFSKDPVGLRSVSEDGRNCFYHPPEEKPKSIGCAIGMFIDDAKSKKMLDSESISTSLSIDLIIKNCDIKRKLLPEWMVMLPNDFLKECQILHDDYDHWDKDGITPLGKQKVNQICDKWDLPRVVIQ